MSIEHKKSNAFLRREKTFIILIKTLKVRKVYFNDCPPHQPHQFFHCVRNHQRSKHWSDLSVREWQTAALPLEELYRWAKDKAKRWIFCPANLLVRYSSRAWKIWSMCSCFCSPMAVIFFSFIILNFVYQKGLYGMMQVFFFNAYIMRIMFWNISHFPLSFMSILVTKITEKEYKQIKPENTKRCNEKKKEYKMENLKSFSI